MYMRWKLSLIPQYECHGNKEDDGDKQYPISIECMYLCNIYQVCRLLYSIFQISVWGTTDHMTALPTVQLPPRTFVTCHTPLSVHVTKLPKTKQRNNYCVVKTHSSSSWVSLV